MWLDGEWQRNDKRSGFLPFLDLPRRTTQPLELALCLAPDEQDERQRLQDQGWCVRHAHEVASTPQDYKRYIQASRGEFSCAKPSCVRLQNAWISDRTLCYLASGKPAVVQHTGPSRFLPDADGLFRFHDAAGAAAALERVAADYGRQCRQARALAEEHFDARQVVGRILERVLDRSPASDHENGRRHERETDRRDSCLSQNRRALAGWMGDVVDTSELEFIAYLSYLRGHAREVIVAAALLRGLSDPEGLPHRAAVVTFDDGYRYV